MTTPNPTATDNFGTNWLATIDAKYNALDTWKKRMGSLAATAFIINGLFHFVVKTPFTATLSIIFGSVLLTEHLLLNLYIGFHNRHKTVDRWSLSHTEKVVITIAIGFLAAVLNLSIINIFSNPLVYRAIPLSWAMGIGLASGNIIVDVLKSY